MWMARSSIEKGKGEKGHSKEGKSNGAGGRARKGNNGQNPDSGEG